MNVLMGRTERPSRLDLALEPRTQVVAAGTRARYALRIHNRGAPGDVQLAIDPGSSDWCAWLPVDRLCIPTGTATTVFLRVDAPADAFVGTRECFRVGAKAGTGKWRWHEVELRVEDLA